MQSTYNAFVDRMITMYEGKYGWSKSDPGGPTKYGITCFDLAQHRHQTMTSMTTWAPIVQAMPLSEAEEIYADKYATGICYNALPAGVDACMMDYAVNSGVSRAVLVARAITGVKTLGMTYELVTAISKMPAETFIRRMCAERLAFMKRIKGGSLWKVYGRGWTSRVTDLTTYCLRLAGINAVLTPTPYLAGADVMPKATSAPVAVPTLPSAAAVVGAPLATATAGLPWYVIAGSVVAIVAGGVAYTWWDHARSAHENATVVVPTGA